MPHHDAMCSDCILKQLRVGDRSFRLESLARIPTDFIPLAEKRLEMIDILKKELPYTKTAEERIWSLKAISEWCGDDDDDMRGFYMSSMQLFEQLPSQLESSVQGLALQALRDVIDNFMLQEGELEADEYGRVLSILSNLCPGIQGQPLEDFFRTLTLLRSSPSFSSFRDGPEGWEASIRKVLDVSLTESDPKLSSMRSLLVDNIVQFYTERLPERPCKMDDRVCQAVVAIHMQLDEIFDGTPEVLDPSLG